MACGEVREGYACYMNNDYDVKVCTLLGGVGHVKDLIGAHKMITGGSDLDPGLFVIPSERPAMNDHSFFLGALTEPCPSLNGFGKDFPLISASPLPSID